MQVEVSIESNNRINVAIQSLMISKLILIVAKLLQLLVFVD